MRFTIFTPTYNRGYIIQALYKSLQQQTYRDFEWLVIDDGSTDNTEQIFKKILQETNDFDITYLKTENGGKHRAINKAVKIAKGELFFIVDSDDFLTDDALEIANNIEKTINANERHKYSGICGLKGFSKTKAVGKSFSKEQGKYLDITTLDRQKYGISGDKSEIFYTEVLKQYPFPEFAGENFITECVVWDRIANDGYIMRFFNEIIYICDYLEDGLTSHAETLFRKNPKGYGLYLYQSSLYGKTVGVNKWNSFLKYYYNNRDSLRFKEIAHNLHQNVFALKLRIIGMQIFYKIYDK